MASGTEQVHETVGAHEEASGGMNLAQILGQVGFDWQVALANLVNFIIVLVILKMFVFKPVQNLLAKRKAMIEKGLADAASAGEKLATAETESKRLVETAKVDAEAVLVEARSEGARVKERIEEVAREKEAEIIRLAHERADEDHEKMIEDVRSEAADLVVNAATKLLAEEVDAKTHQKYAEKVTAMLAK